MAVFIVRLFYLQVIRHDYYVAQANREQLKQLTIPAKRGEIYAMDSGTPVPLVLNQAVYTVFADPKIVDEPQKMIDTIRRVAGGNARDNLDGLLAKKDSRYQILATKVTRKQAELMKKEHLKGLGFQEESQRVYPEGQLAAQVLGFVNSEGKGQYGLEGALNKDLTGKDGLLQSVTDISNVPLTIGNKNINIPPKNGKNVVMTIDRNMQAYAERALANGLQAIKGRIGTSEDPKGSVLVMDPQTGKVLAMANLPTYNPGEYGKVQDAAAFNNETISVPYEPGSDIKTITMTTGVDKGVVGPESTYNNTDYITVDDATITNATKGQTGNITLQHALNYSLNTGFVTVAQRLGDGKSINWQARSTMYDYFYNKLRLGQMTGIELANEQPGIIIPPSDPQGNAVRYSNMSFGQGLDVTMLQVSAAFSAVVNGGTYHTPSIVAGSMNDDGDVFTPAAAKPSYQGVIKPSTSDTMRRMIHDARSAFYAGKDKKGYYIGGKTGTSQTIENGRYVDNQTVGTYLGFGGDSNSAGGPKYVIMVQVSGKNMNLQGGLDAMPIFTDISNWLLSYMKLQPKG
ncbi:MAG TPA: penicillin-binding protein 2 [Candidatus Saccharimonadales bacterium]|nr:penicillin-binding protein 2 [Candidatus Saccharimonadales bacterium]